MSLPKDILDRLLTSSLGEAAYNVCETLTNAGEQCWWVGGATRSMLLEELPREIDMATSAKPEAIAKLFKKSDSSAAALGTVIVSMKGHTFELTTFREDHDVSDGRRPESVQFSTIEKDALRRDATINAIYFDPVSGKIFDPTDGQKDIKEKLVRFIGDPVTRIKQDALRILRMVRLKATINGQYHPATYKALEAEAAHTKILSGPRILQELEKMLLCPHPDAALNDLHDLNVLKAILPELHACKGVAQPKDYHLEGDVWAHTLKAISTFTDDHGIDVRLATLFHDSGKVQTFSLKERIRFDHHAEESEKVVESVFKRFQMSSDRIQKIRWLVGHHMMMDTFKDLSDTRKAHWYFHPWFKELLQLFSLDIAGTEPADFSQYDRIISDYDQFLNAHPRPAKPLLNGKEVMEILGLKPGEKVGEILQGLHDAQVEKKITTKADAKKYLKDIASRYT